MIKTLDGIRVERTGAVGILYFSKDGTIVERDRFDLRALRDEATSKETNWIDLVLTKTRDIVLAYGVDIVQYCTMNTNIVIERRYR